LRLIDLTGIKIYTRIHINKNTTPLRHPNTFNPDSHFGRWWKNGLNCNAKMRVCVFLGDREKKYDASYPLNMMLSRTKSVRITMRLVCATICVYRIRCGKTCEEMLGKFWWCTWRRRRPRKPRDSPIPRTYMKYVLQNRRKRRTMDIISYIYCHTRLQL